MVFLRRTIKLLLASILYYSGLMQFVSNRGFKKSRDRLFTILTYHRILNNHEGRKADTQPGMCVTQDSFDKQLAFLNKKYYPLSLNDLSDALKNDRVIRDRTVVVTFDDGWYDNYTLAYKILKHHKMPVTIFLPTDLIASNNFPSFIHVSLLLGEGELWPHKAVDCFIRVVKEHKLDQEHPALSAENIRSTGNNAFDFMLTMMNLSMEQIDEVSDKLLQAAGIEREAWYARRWLMNWDEIREMNDSLIDFSSHGQSHDLMINISLEQVEQELKESKRIIESELGEPVKLFSYPNGDYNQPIKQLVEQAGYECAVTVSGCDDSETLPDRFALRRVNINEGAALGPLGNFSKTIFAAYLEGIF